MEIALRNIKFAPIQAHRNDITMPPNRNIFCVNGLCEGKPPVTGIFPSQRPVTRRFDVFFEVHLNKPMNKQWSCRWYETPLCPCDVTVKISQHNYVDASQFMIPD